MKRFVINVLKFVLRFIEVKPRYVNVETQTPPILDAIVEEELDSDSLLYYDSTGFFNTISEYPDSSE